MNRPTLTGSVIVRFPAQRRPLVLARQPCPACAAHGYMLIPINPLAARLHTAHHNQAVRP